MVEAGVIGVDVAFDTGQVDPPERLPAWRELVNRVFLPLDIAPLDVAPLAAPGRPGAFGGSMTGSDRGELRVWRVRATPLSAVRAVRHIRSSGCDDYLLGLHVSGTAVAAQDDRQVTLGPGDFALFDSARPYRIAFRGPGVFEHVIFQVPRASLEARGRAVGTQTALRVPAASRAGRLASPYLRTLAQDEPPAQAFIDTGLDLAASALRATAGPDPDPDPIGRPAPAGELKRYALAHLGDPALSPQAVARAGYLSVRQLHRLFALEGVSFGAWLLEQRLRRCRDDLADTKLSRQSVAEVAARWGFRSPAHFTRAFHARYGTTPGELRRAARRP